MLSKDIFYIPVYYILSATVIIYPACTNLLWSLLNFLFTNKCNFLLLESQGDQSTQTWGGFTCSSLTRWSSQNPEMTAANIQGRLEKQCGIQLSKEYVCMLRRKLNWTPKHMKYGQLISHKNVKHRLDWCLDQLISKDSFRDVIYVDESTVEMCSSGRLFSTGMDPTWIDYQLRHPNQSTHIKLMCGAAYRAEEEQVSVYFLE